MQLRRWVGALTAAAALVAASVPTYAAWPAQYADVDQWPAWAMKRDKTANGIWIYTGGDLAEAVWWELMIGDPPATGNLSEKRHFRPHDTITRAEFATILSRALGANVPDGKGSDWFRPHVTGLAERGVLADGDDWSAPILRREMGEWVGRALTWYGLDNREGTDPPDFPDITGLPERGDILQAARFGVIKGYEDRTFRPDQTATRTEAAAMVVRMAKLLRKHAPTAEELLDVLKGFDGLGSQAMRDLATTGVLDLRRLEPYSTSLGLYGPEGINESVESIQRGRPEFGWPTAFNYRVQPILLRDTVAIVRVALEAQPYMKTGEPYPGGTMKHDSYYYLVRREGRWLKTNAKSRFEYEPGQEPKAE